MGPPGSLIRPREPQPPASQPWSLRLSPEAPRPHLRPQHRTYLGIYQADAEGDQPQEISIGKAEPLHIEADLPLPGLTGHFVGQVLGPQHLLIVQEGIPT